MQEISLEKYKRDLALKGYALRTQSAYLKNVEDFLYKTNKSLAQISGEDIKDYLYDLINKDLSESTLKQARGSIKYFFSQTLNRPIEVVSIPTIKKKKTLPLFFSQEEIIRLKYLEKYWKTCHPKDFFFIGRQDKPISCRSVQRAFENAKKKAGIKKPGGMHSLRHSFATHFLEYGGSIFQLQTMLGHKHI